MSRWGKVRVSIIQGLQALGKWYGIIGFLAAASASINLITSLLALDIATFLAPFITVYRSIAHPLIDVLTVWLPFELPLYVKDLVVLYGIIGGSVARAYEEYRQVRRGGLKEAWISLLGKPSPPGRNLYDPKEWPPVRFYRASPKWLRMLFDVVLWPITIVEAFKKPIASMGRTSSGTWYSTAKTWEEAEHNKREGHISTFDLRINFATQLLVLLFIVAVVVGLNAYALTSGS